MYAFGTVSRENSRVSQIDNSPTKVASDRKSPLPHKSYEYIEEDKYESDSSFSIPDEL